jgi:hypothetical protein
LEVLSVCIWAVPLVAAFVVARHNAIAELILGGSILLIGIVTYAYSPHPVMATAVPEFVREACRAWAGQQ